MTPDTPTAEEYQAEIYRTLPQSYDLSVTAARYAETLEQIAKRKELLECHALLKKGYARFVEELARFEVEIEESEIVCEYEGALDYNAKPELFCKFKGLMFANIGDNLQCLGADVFVQKHCQSCRQPIYKHIDYRDDWLAAVGVFLRSDKPCYTCEENADKQRREAERLWFHDKSGKSQQEFIADMQQRSPSGKLLVDGHEIDDSYRV